MAKHKKSSRKSGGRFGIGGLGGIKGIVNKVLVGFGAGAAGAIIADRTGLNPLIPSGALGFLAAGPIGAIVALVLPMLTRSLGTGQSSGAQVGQVVWA